jgi:predicted XRE-type DNA-binding protein
MRAPDPIPPLKDEIARVVVERLHGWSHGNAAALLHTDQPRMSDLRNGRLGRFSLEQLIRFASRLGADVHFP